MRGRVKTLSSLFFKRNDIEQLSHLGTVYPLSPPSQTTGEEEAAATNDPSSFHAPSSLTEEWVIYLKNDQTGEDAILPRVFTDIVVATAYAIGLIEGVPDDNTTKFRIEPKGGYEDWREYRKVSDHVERIILEYFPDREVLV